MEFVRATGQDGAALREIARNSEAHWGFTEEFMAVFDDAYNITAGFIEENPVYAGVDGGEIICFWGMKKQDGGWELEYFYTSDKRIGKGCGRQMWEHFTGWCREHQVPQVRWVTSPEAIGFYLKMGAKRLGDARSGIDGRPIPRFMLALYEETPASG